MTKKKTDPAKQSKFREWEKERRDRLNKSFEDLAKVLPQYTTAKCLSKIEILQISIRLIEELQQKNRELLAGNNTTILKSQDELEEGFKILVVRNQQLLNLLLKAGIKPPEFEPPQIFGYIVAQSTIIGENNCNQLNLNCKTVGRPPKYSNRLTKVQATILQCAENSGKLDRRKKTIKRKITDETIETISSENGSTTDPVNNSTDPTSVTETVISTPVVATTVRLENNQIIPIAVTKPPLLILKEIKIQPRTGPRKLAPKRRKKTSNIINVQPPPGKVAIVRYKSKRPIPIKKKRIRGVKKPIPVTSPKKLDEKEKSGEGKITDESNKNETVTDLEDKLPENASNSIDKISEDETKLDSPENRKETEKKDSPEMDLSINDPLIESLSPTAAFLMSFPVVSSAMGRIDELEIEPNQSEDKVEYQEPPKPEGIEKPSKGDDVEPKLSVSNQSETVPTPIEPSFSDALQDLPTFSSDKKQSTENIPKTTGNSIYFNWMSTSKSDVIVSMVNPTTVPKPILSDPLFTFSLSSTTNSMLSTVITTGTSNHCSTIGFYDSLSSIGTVPKPTVVPNQSDYQSPFKLNIPSTTSFLSPPQTPFTFSLTQNPTGTSVTGKSIGPITSTSTATGSFTDPIFYPSIGTPAYPISGYNPFNFDTVTVPSTYSTPTFVGTFTEPMKQIKSVLGKSSLIESDSFGNGSINQKDLNRNTAVPVVGVGSQSSGNSVKAVTPSISKHPASSIQSTVPLPADKHPIGLKSSHSNSFSVQSVSSMASTPVGQFVKSHQPPIGNKQPVNWMTTETTYAPEKNYPDYSTFHLPPAIPSVSFSQYDHQNSSYNSNNYFPVPPPSHPTPQNVPNQNIDLQRKSDVYFAHPTGDENVPWSPNYMVPGNLPTLHGDLALNNLPAVNSIGCCPPITPCVTTTSVTMSKRHQFSYQPDVPLNYPIDRMVGQVNQSFSVSNLVEQSPQSVGDGGYLSVGKPMVKSNKMDGRPNPRTVSGASSKRDTTKKCGGNKSQSSKVTETSKFTLSNNLFPGFPNSYQPMPQTSITDYNSIRNRTDSVTNPKQNISNNYSAEALLSNTPVKRDVSNLLPHPPSNVNLFPNQDYNYNLLYPPPTTIGSVVTSECSGNNLPTDTANFSHPNFYGSTGYPHHTTPQTPHSSELDYLGAGTVNGGYPENDKRTIGEYNHGLEYRSDRSKFNEKSTITSNYSTLYNPSVIPTPNSLSTQYFPTFDDPYSTNNSFNCPGNKSWTNHPQTANSYSSIPDSNPAPYLPFSLSTSVGNPVGSKHQPPNYHQHQQSLTNFNLDRICPEINNGRNKGQNNWSQN